MDLPNELPIVYSERILIPGFDLKIKFLVKNHPNLLDYLSKNVDTNAMIGIIPKIDLEKADDVIGTVGKVCSIIQMTPDSEEFFLIVQGICRFKLDANVSEEPLKINKIVPITNFEYFIGDVKERIELTTEFEEALNDFLKYLDPELFNSNQNMINELKKVPVYQKVDIFLQNIELSPDDTYEVLRATNLNDLVTYITQWLRLETIKSIKNFNTIKTNTFQPPPTFVLQLNNNNSLPKKHLSPELEELQTAIKTSDMPTPITNVIMEEFKRLRDMKTTNSEYIIGLQHLSFVVNLPWGKSSTETLDLEKAKTILKLNHYGMDKIKKRILSFIAVRILNPKRRGPILCFVGPSGVGKTTIAKSIADSLDRKFKRISLGGMNKVSDIKGHRKTYIGSMPGCIIEAVNQAQTKNPVILLDEIDKMSNGGHGDPAAALLEVLDPVQNGSFVDSYVNFPFDLSQVMFVSTANNTATIPWSLRDRLDIIHLDGYTHEEKVQIAENYLIPKILKEHKMNEVPINFCKNTVNDIIQKYTHESGVRDLQRKLEEICDYIALDIVESRDKEMKSYVITPKSLLDIFGYETCNDKNALIKQCSNRIGVAFGLFWTPVCANVHMIEVSRIYSKSGLSLTGLAGQTLRESVKIALNWTQSFAKKNEFYLKKFRVHVHFPDGALKKDGPSAGITIVSALISLIWQIPLRPMIAMTGEISLNGYVLPVGGLKQKIIAAYNFGINTVIIPQLNLKDLKSLPKNIEENMKIIPVKHLEEVLDIVIPGGLSFLQNPSAKLLPKSKI